MNFFVLVIGLYLLISYVLIKLLGLISDVYSGKLKLPITVDDVMLCEVDEYVREDELLFELEWIIMFLSIVYNVGLK